MLRYRLGVELPLPPTCLSCGRSQDPFGDHTLSCSRVNFVARHNTLCAGLGRLLLDSGFAVQREVPLPLPQTQERPADLLVANFAESRPLALDISVVHPLQPSSSIAGASPGRLADERALTKINHYRAACSVAQWDFSPITFETTGAWSASTATFVRRWSLLVGMSTGSPAAKCFATLSWAVSTLLAKAVGENMARGLGNNFPQLPSISLPLPSPHPQSPQPERHLGGPGARHPRMDTTGH